MAEIEYRFVWERRDAQVARDAAEFWRGLGVLGPAEVEERTGELCAVAYAEGEVAGVCTIRLFDFRPLRARLAFYRTMIAPAFRRHQLASRLCVYSIDQLTAWGREHPEEKLKGLFIVLESDDLFPGRKHQPVIRQLDHEMIFVGYASDGHQLRVVWFEDASVE